MENHQILCFTEHFNSWIKVASVFETHKQEVDEGVIWGFTIIGNFSHCKMKTTSFLKWLIQAQMQSKRLFSNKGKMPFCQGHGPGLEIKCPSNTFSLP